MERERTEGAWGKKNSSKSNKLNDTPSYGITQSELARPILYAHAYYLATIHGVLYLYYCMCSIQYAFEVYTVYIDRYQYTTYPR